MKFGRIASGEAEGAILAHGVKLPDGMLKKGRVISAADVNALAAAGIAEVMAARLDADDVPEDEAARQLAVAGAGAGSAPQQAFTGRANIHAQGMGLLVVDEARVRAINQLHESLTIATLPTFSVVTARQMLATVKIIPFATPRHVLAKALKIVGEKPLVHVQAFRPQRISLIITTLPQTKAGIIEKSEHAIRERLQHLGLGLHTVSIVAHEQDAIAAAVRAEAQSDCILVFGASAIVDRGDVIPAGLVDAGGTVVHLGMPVDPGNLLMLGAIGKTDVIGVPSCARSPKRNGFDWVLERVLAGVAVSAHDIMDMGAGGLLAEIPSRPRPRELAASAAPIVSGVVLAAGLSRRMGANKMLAQVNGVPMVRVVVQNLLASAVDEVIVVTGHAADAVAAALDALQVKLVHNADYATGLSSSVRAGVAAAQTADAVVVALGDMPRVAPETIDRLIAAYNPTEHRSIVVPTHGGHFGNPVLWGKEHFARLLSLTGDKGARALISDLKAEATEIEVTDDSVLLDADTPEALVLMQSRV